MVKTAMVKTSFSPCQGGFSLIEAMVALTILAGATLALFGWINTSLNQLNRAGFYTEASPALTSATEYLNTVDLANRPTGTFNSGRVEVEWQATPIEQEVSRTPDQGGGNFLLSLYEVELTLQLNGRTLPPLITRIVNYRLKPDVQVNPFGL